MKRHWNNKGRIILSSMLFALGSILLALCYLLYPERASSGPYLVSAHGDSITGVLRTSLSTVYTRGHCGHCHEQHASIGGSEPVPDSPAGPDEYLVFQDYSGNTSKNAFCNKCHTSTGSLQSGSIDDIASSYTKTYKHTPTMVSCIDCHMPHTAQKTTLDRPPGNAVASTSPIRDTWGVEPTFSAPGTPPAGSETLSTPTYTVVNPITKEYQLCLKCHSSYSYGGSPPSGWTDQGKEFNPYNYCLHPVTGTGGVTQWKNPIIRANYTTLLKAPWNANLDARMYCSDCHGDADAGTPKGPHGSNKKYLLKAWGGVNASKTRFPNAANSYDDLCLLCHIEAYSGGAMPAASPWSHASNAAHQYEGETCSTGYSETVSYVDCLGCTACHGGPGGYADFTATAGSGPSNGGRTGAIHGENFYWDNPGTEPNNPADHFLVGGFNVGIRLDNYSGGNDGDGNCWAAGKGKNDSPCGAMTGGKAW